MLTNLQSYLPYFKQYSKTLDDISSFIDIPWSFIDENGIKTTYIFHKHGDILVSRQGEVTRGVWDYLPQLQSLLIQTQAGVNIYNQEILLDKAVMVLRKDGTEELFALANPDCIPDLDIVNFFENFEPPWLQKMRIKAFRPAIKKLSNGRMIALTPANDGTLYDFRGSSVTYVDNGSPLTDGTYALSKYLNVVVKSGKVKTFRNPVIFIMFKIVISILIIDLLVLIFLL